MNRTRTWPNAAQRERIGLGGVLLAYLLIAIRSLHAPFFVLDDLEQVHFVRSLDHWSGLFGTDFYHFFRPVKNLLFAGFVFLHDAFGMAAIRFTAICIGVFALLSVHTAARRLIGRPEQALVLTAIWALGPTLVSSTVWLSCVNILLMSGFAAWALYCHERTATAQTAAAGAGWAAAAGAALALTLVSYEGGISLLAILFAADVFLRPSRLAHPRRWGLYAWYGVIGVTYLFLRLRVDGQEDLYGSFSASTRTDAVLAAGWFTWQHLSTWIWPFGNMAVVGGYTPDLMPNLALGFGWVVVAALAAFCLFARRRYPEMAFGIAWFLLGFAPMSNLTGFMNGPWGDYYMTLASVGLALACSDILRRLVLFQHPPHRRLAALTLVAVLVTIRLAAVFEAAVWSHAWNDPKEVYARTLRTFPAAFDAMTEKAKLLIAEGELDQAEAWVTKALAVAPDRIRNRPVLAIIALHRQDYESARTHATAFLQQQPDDPWALGFIGYLEEEYVRDAERATYFYERAVAHHPWSADTLFAADRLAFLYAEKGRTKEAIVLWKNVLRYRPTDSATRHNLAIASRHINETDTPAIP